MESKNTNFITGNTIAVSLPEIENNHIIPVHTKDNSRLISYSEYIRCIEQGIQSSIALPHELVGIHCSHPVKGRTPDAIGKRKEDLLPHEQTLYYERMIALFRIPSIKRNINGHEVSLTVGGIKAYNLDNFNKDCTGPQHFKIFYGFQVKVCSNLCVWTDEGSSTIVVNEYDHLQHNVHQFMNDLDYDHTATQLNKLSSFTIDEQAFAGFIGRCKMYVNHPSKKKLNAPDLDLTDYQINKVVRNYYQDPHFGNVDHQITLWSLYNLFTEATKTTYIDRFIDRTKDVSLLMMDLINHLDGEKESFFLQDLT